MRGGAQGSWGGHHWKGLAHSHGWGGGHLEHRTFHDRVPSLGRLSALVPTTILRLEPWHHDHLTEKGTEAKATTFSQAPSLGFHWRLCELKAASYQAGSRDEDRVGKLPRKQQGRELFALEAAADPAPSLHRTQSGTRS
jgi:hypothetical protein